MHFRRAMPMMVAISCVLCSLSGAEVELVPGVPIEREIARGETHAYQIKLAAGQYLQAVADQRGIDLRTPFHSSTHSRAPSALSQP